MSPHKICDHCNGTGKVIHHGDERGPEHEKKCRKCDGTGQIPIVTTNDDPPPGNDGN